MDNLIIKLEVIDAHTYSPTLDDAQKLNKNREQLHFKLVLGRNASQIIPLFVGDAH